MTEYVCIRASEILNQGELVAFLKSQFPRSTSHRSKLIGEGTETVETRLPAHTSDLEKIRNFILERRNQGLHGFSDYSIGRYLRKYTDRDLQMAEILRIKISSHFEPAGEECGTIYENLCDHCNWGRQISNLTLDLRRVPQHMDIAETIAWVEWVVSSKFVQTFKNNDLTGADFQPILDVRNPMRPSVVWHQLQITGTAGPLAEETQFGWDPFSPSDVIWRCPLGHSAVGQFISEIYLRRKAWDGSDIAVTTSLFGQGRNLLRPVPIIVASQRAYRAFKAAGIKGLSYEPVHLL
jgi:hypothetical protein